MARQKDNEQFHPEPDEIDIALYEGGKPPEGERYVKGTGRGVMHFAYSLPQPYLSEEKAAMMTVFHRDEGYFIDAITPADALVGNLDRSSFSKFSGLDQTRSYQALFRPIRWLAANLVNWKHGDFIPIDDLDGQRLPGGGKETRQPLNVPSQPALDNPKK